MRYSYANVVQGGETSKTANSTHTSEDDNSEENQQINTQHAPLYNPDVVDNNLHPLFVHNTDHPGLILIAKKLIGPDNFQWHLCKTRCYLSTFCTMGAKEISDGLNYVTAVSEVWQKLHGRFSGVNEHIIFQVLKDIHSIEQGNNFVEVYFHKLKGLWDEYSVLEPIVNCVCGAHKIQVQRDQKRKLFQFLTGLHDNNAIIRGQILMMSLLPSLSQAYAFVKQNEKARQGYQIAGHSGSGFRKPSQSFIGTSRPVLKCTYCNFNGHTKERCYKLIGYPPN
ncbi:uncharacterized protein LOC141704161 [Apium graveolens]|uniref:uncharacterized protein LOC141704161 n=1 Tax=Apium graveolens TaxID=4045 RepID=UPI003D7B3A68